MFSSTFAFTENTAWFHIFQKNRCLILQSTLHNREDVTSGIDKKPRIIIDYNKTKGSVDSVNKKIACYLQKENK